MPSKLSWTLEIRLILRLIVFFLWICYLERENLFGCRFREAQGLFVLFHVENTARIGTNLLGFSLEIFIWKIVKVLQNHNFHIFNSKEASISTKILKMIWKLKKKPMTIWMNFLHPQSWPSQKRTLHRPSARCVYPGLRSVRRSRDTLPLHRTGLWGNNLK